MRAKRKKMSPSKKNTRSFIKGRISFYSDCFHDLKNQVSNALEEKRVLERKIGTKEPSKAEAERLKLLSCVADQAREQANQYRDKMVEWKNKKNEFFPVAK